MAIRRLATELGLESDDLLAAEPAGSKPLYYFGGTPYTYAQATQDFAQIYNQLKSDVQASSYPTTYDSSTPRGRELDATSIADYIDQIVPGGHDSPLGKLLDVAYNIEFGAETWDQSALNLLYLLGYSSKQEFQIFGESDERFHIRGGNDQLVSRMAATLGNRIHLNSELESISKRSDGTYILSIRQGGRSVTVAADHVVLALPFSILRQSVDFSGAGFSPLKSTAIREMGMGTNSKFQMQFRNRLWNAQGGNGDTYSDTGYQVTWEATRAQSGQSGVLVNYSGGEIGLTYDRPASQLAGRVLNQLEPVLPGISAEFNGLALLDYWPGYRWTRGSYTYWKVGQYVGFAGVKGEREGNVHFCGEHTSIDFQGFLNGAVDSAEGVATEILHST